MNAPRDRILNYREPFWRPQPGIPFARRLGEPWWVSATLGLGGLACICLILLVWLAISSATYEWFFR